MNALKLRHRAADWQAAVDRLFDLDPLHRDLSAMFEGLDDLTPLITETRPADHVLDECLARHEQICREQLGIMTEARPESIVSIAARFEDWWRETDRRIRSARAE